MKVQTVLAMMSVCLAGCLSVGPYGAGRGGVVQEVWHGVPGETVGALESAPGYPDSPAALRVLDRFESGSIGDAFGCRYTASLIPPTTGTYTFWIASDDASELWLETEPRHRLASVSGWTSPEAWDTQPTQRSPAVHLDAGHTYGLTALHKEGGGGDHLAVAWAGPGLERQVITAPYLQRPQLTAFQKEALARTERDDAAQRRFFAQAEAYWSRGATLPVAVTHQAQLSSEGPPANDTGVNVLLDQSHQTQFAMLWGFRGRIRSQGFRVTSSLAALDSVLTPGRPSRCRVRIGDMEPFAWVPTPEFNVLVIHQADLEAQPYTPEERASVRAFVAAGGGMLVFGRRPPDADKAAQWTMNQLLAQFGAAYTESEATCASGVFAALSLADPWEALVTSADGNKVVRARRQFGRGRILIAESTSVFNPGRNEDPEAIEHKMVLLRESLQWLAAGKAPVGGNADMPHLGGVGIFPEREQNLGSVVVYYAANQKAEVMDCIETHIPSAARQIRDWLPTKTFAEPYNIVICAGGGGGWAINGRPKAAAVISYDSLGILGIFAHEMAHTMGGPRNSKGELAGLSPHHNQGEAHAGWFQGKIQALFSGKTDMPNRNCNRILALEKKKGRMLDVAREHETKEGRAVWGKGPEWTKLWYIWQKLDDRYGPTWYPRWYWVRSMRWMDEPGHRETWDEMVEDMSIAVGEDLFPFFRAVGTTLEKERFPATTFLGETLTLPKAPIDSGPAGPVNLTPIGDYRKPLHPMISAPEAIP